ncbi:hypothetical protein Q9966_013179 [Columba livia]|nr:hypothetical protein Q9966_013179 [Columba livia]
MSQEKSRAQCVCKKDMEIACHAAGYQLGAVLSWNHHFDRCLLTTAGRPIWKDTRGPEDLDSICCVPETHLEVQDMENTLGVGRNSKVLVELACVTVTPKDRLEAVELHGGFQSKESGTALTSHNGRSYFPLEWLFVLLAMKPPKLSRAILKIPSVLGRHKAFSTCSSHLGVVTLFYGSATVVYLKRRSRDSVDIDKYLALFYTIVTPMFNPLIYSLRNKESIFSAPKLLNANSYFKLCLTKVTLKGNSQSMANSKWGPEGDTIDEEMTIFRAEKPLARPHGLPTISPHGISLKKIKDLQVIFCCCPEDLDNIRCVPETHLEGRDMEKAFDVVMLIKPEACAATFGLRCSLYTTPLILDV